MENSVSKLEQTLVIYRQDKTTHSVIIFLKIYGQFYKMIFFLLGDWEKNCGFACTSHFLFFPRARLYSRKKVYLRTFLVTPNKHHVFCPTFGIVVDVVMVAFFTLLYYKFFEKTFAFLPSIYFV